MIADRDERYVGQRSAPNAVAQIAQICVAADLQELDGTAARNGGSASILLTFPRYSG